MLAIKECIFVAFVVCLFISLFNLWFIFFDMYFLIQLNKNFRAYISTQIWNPAPPYPIKRSFFWKTDKQTDKQQQVLRLI